MHERSLRYHALALRAVAPVFVLVALLHLALGVRADALLGAQVPETLFGEPSLNSQNRFSPVRFPPATVGVDDAFFGGIGGLEPFGSSYPSCFRN